MKRRNCESTMYETQATIAYENIPVKKSEMNRRKIMVSNNSNNKDKSGNCNFVFCFASKLISIS